MSSQQNVVSLADARHRKNAASLKHMLNDAATTVETFATEQEYLDHVIVELVSRAALKSGRNRARGARILTAALVEWEADHGSIKPPLFRFLSQNLKVLHHIRLRDANAEMARRAAIEMFDEADGDAAEALDMFDDLADKAKPLFQLWVGLIWVLLAVG